MITVFLFSLLVLGCAQDPSKNGISENTKMLQERVQRLENSITSIQGALTSLQAEMKSLRKLSTEVSVRNEASSMSDTGNDNYELNTGKRVFVYNWFIPDVASWNETYQEDETIKSPRFYISPRGFRMFLITYPIGRSELPSSTLEYVGVYAGVAKGAYDDHLKWPFNLRYDICIVDQTDDNPQNFETTTYPGLTCGNFDTSPVFTDILQDRYQLGVHCGNPFVMRREFMFTRNYVKDGKLLVRLKVYLE